MENPAHAVSSMDIAERARLFRIFTAQHAVMRSQETLIRCYMERVRVGDDGKKKALREVQQRMYMANIKLFDARKTLAMLLEEGVAAQKKQPTPDPAKPLRAYVLSDVHERARLLLDTAEYAGRSLESEADDKAGRQFAYAALRAALQLGWTLEPPQPLPAHPPVVLRHLKPGDVA